MCLAAPSLPFLSLLSTLSLSLSVPISGRRLPPPTSRGCRCHIAACGALREQLTPRFLAPGWAPAAAEPCQPGPRPLAPTRTSAPSQAPLPARTTSEADLAGPGDGLGTALARGPESRARIPPPGQCAGGAPAARAPRALTQCGADHEGQQRPHGCAAHAAPPSRAAGINSGARGGGTRRRLECPRERAGAAAAALGPARGEGGRGPPAPVTAGGPAPGPGVRASPPRGRRPLLGLLRWRAQPATSARCADPGPALARAR